MKNSKPKSKSVRDLHARSSVVAGVLFLLFFVGCAAYQPYEGSDRVMRYDPPLVVTAVNSEYTVELSEITPTIGTILVKFYVHERRTAERGEKLYDRFAQKSQWRLDDVDLVHDGPADSLKLICSSMDGLLIVDDSETVCNEQGQALIRIRPATGYSLAGESDQGLARFAKDADPIQSRLKVVFMRSEGSTLEGEDFSYMDSTYFKIDLVDVGAGIAIFMREKLLKQYTVHVQDLESGEAITKGDLTLEMKSDPERLLMAQFKEDGIEAAKAAFPFEQTAELDDAGNATFYVMRNGDYELMVDASRYPEFKTIIDKFADDKTVELYRGKGEMSSRIK